MAPTTTTSPLVATEKPKLSKNPASDAVKVVEGQSTAPPPAMRGDNANRTSVALVRDQDNAPGSSCAAIVASLHRDSRPNRIVPGGVPDESISGERFEPPYLFSGDAYAARPVIGYAPASIAYNSQFTINLGGFPTFTIAKVCLIRPAAVTHGF